MANVIEEAKSGRASCRTCKKAIAKGELRLGVEQVTQFSDTPSMQWHHLLCAAGKLPVELKEALGTYDGDVPDRPELDKAMGEAIKKGGAKPGGFPHVDRAPTGRAKCMQCEEPIAKDSFRVAVEREVDTGAFTTRGAGYLHPKCVAENLENVGGDMEEFLAGVKKNSRIPENDLETVVGELGGEGGGDGDGD
ncbi:MAG: PARP-type zinc finger-containing protein [Myxococcota bacterium]|nr:PARP-type zinc finger-containing protein [Myxococcota bacterium]